MRSYTLIWNAEGISISNLEDALKIRFEDKIVGDFVGTLPGQAPQNEIRGLPFVITIQESLALEGIQSK